MRKMNGDERASKTRKTVLRTVRLSQELDDLLRKDAEENDLSINSLINKIMAKYIEWDRHIKKFRFVSVTSETLRAFFNEVGDEKLENIAKELGSDLTSAVSMLWSEKVDLDAFLRMISLYSKYSGLFIREFRADERGYVITFHHKLGIKWSIFLKHFMSQSFKSALGIEPETFATANLAVISFRKRPSESRN